MLLLHMCFELPPHYNLPLSRPPVRLYISTLCSIISVGSYYTFMPPSPVSPTAAHKLYNKCLLCRRSKQSEFCRRARFGITRSIEQRHDIILWFIYCTGKKEESIKKFDPDWRALFPIFVPFLYCVAIPIRNMFIALPVIFIV